MIATLLNLLCDTSPCPSRQMAGDKVKLVQGWRVNARSCKFSVLPGPFPKAEATHGPREGREGRRRLLDAAADTLGLLTGC